VLSAVVFLGLNGIELMFDEPMIVTIVYGLAASEVTKADFAQWLRDAAVTP
jgi:prophage maintenance system killer protein